MDISIHAPAKGATIAQINFFIPIYISIHAPAKGATRLRHTLRGSKRISIHAPAKGATAILTTISYNITHFNPRSREGSDITSIGQAFINA